MLSRKVLFVKKLSCEFYKDLRFYPFNHNINSLPFNTHKCFFLPLNVSFHFN